MTRALTRRSCIASAPVDLDAAQVKLAEREAAAHELLAALWALKEHATATHDGRMVHLVGRALVAMNAAYEAREL